MKHKGIFEYDLEGRKVGFKFGTYGISIACEKENCTVEELFRRCGMPYLGKAEDGTEEIKHDPPKLKAILHLVYGAAVHYAEDNSHPADFKVSQVSDWLDALGMDTVRPMLTSCLTQYVPKNSQPLEETGGATTP